MSAPVTTSTVTTASPPASLGGSTEHMPVAAMIGIFFAVAILAQVACVACYYCYRKRAERLEHHQRMTVIHDAFTEATIGVHIDSTDQQHSATAPQQNVAVGR